MDVLPDASGGDSCSSADSNSVVQDPVSAQLINNISMLDYQTLSKNTELVTGQVWHSLCWFCRGSSLHRNDCVQFVEILNVDIE